MAMIGMAVGTGQTQVLETYDGAIKVLQEQLAAGQTIGIAVEAADQRICKIDRGKVEHRGRRLIRAKGLQANAFLGDGPVITVTAISLPLTRRRGTERQLLGCAITATVLVGVNVITDGRLLVALVGNSTKTWVIGTGSAADTVNEYLAEIIEELATKLSQAAH